MRPGPHSNAQPGDLMWSDACNIWDVDTRTNPGFVVEMLPFGDLVLVLERVDDDVKVLTSTGKVGWIDCVHKERVHTLDTPRTPK